MFRSDFIEAEDVQPVGISSAETGFSDLWKNGEGDPFAFDIVQIGKTMGSSKSDSKKTASTDLDLANARIRELDIELQSARLEFEEERKLHSRIAQDFANYRTKSETATNEELDRQLEKVFLDISGSVAQLITQDYLLNKNGKPVQAKDVVNVSSGIVKTLLRHGMETVGKVGEETQFDLNSHEPISIDEAITDNENVTIRMVGIAFKGKILRRASVSKSMTTSQSEAP